MQIIVPNEFIVGPLTVEIDGSQRSVTSGRDTSRTTLTFEFSQGPHEVIVKSKRQYSVEVLSEFGKPTGAGLYLEGTSVTIGVNTPIEISPGVRMVFDRWSGDISSSSNGVSVTVDRPLRISANWRKQYFLTVSPNGGSVTGGGWYDAGRTASFSAISPHETVPAKTRLVFTKWSGDSTSDEKTAAVLMNSPRTVMANWKAQHYLSVDPGPGDVGQGSQWLDEGATITIRATTPSRVEPESSRLIFVGWSGDITSMDASTTLRIDGPKTVVVNWKTQYYLRVISERGNPQGEDWYDAGTEATFSVTSPLGTIIRDVFDAWTGDFSGKATVGTITMDSPKSVAANWRRDYTILLFIVGLTSVAAAGVGAAWVLAKKRTKLS